jgi:hypothetical protein
MIIRQGGFRSPRILQAASDLAIRRALADMYPGGRPRSICVYGPAASGKTQHSEELAKHYRLRVVVDEPLPQVLVRFRGILYLSRLPITLMDTVLPIETVLAALNEGVAA